jgi:hypothetical protein
MKVAAEPSARIRPKWVFAAVLAGLLTIAAFIALTLVRAQPVLRELIVDSLRARFHGRVELGSLQVSIGRTVQVSGEDLKIFAPDGPNSQPNTQPLITQPLIASRQFQFTVSLFDFFHLPMRVERVYLQGLELNIPRERQKPLVSAWKKAKMRLQVDELMCDDARLVINTSRPDKPPLEFVINQLRMKDIGPDRPGHFDATLVNPKPVGNIQSSGLFGPWRLENIRSTPVSGQYSFTNADLSTIKGIAGILSSTGEYRGTLGSITVDGQTDTPDFQLTINDHAVPLHTEFHAIVDGTNGDVALQPVHAKLLNSTFTLNGSVVRVNDPRGHRILLDAASTEARIDDLLRLAVRTDPPVITGAADFTARIELQPGSANVIDRLHLVGKFHVSQINFSNSKIQSKVDALSRRTQGKLEQASDTSDSVPSQLNGTFTLANRQLLFQQLQFQVPGTNVFMAGKYSLDGSVFDFHGRVVLQAKPSQMTTGWKSVLLKPLDPLLYKKGRGTEIPISVTGTTSEPHIGLDIGRGNPKQRQ